MDKTLNFDFAALDVETANENFDSICQIGVVLFKGDQVVETTSDLLDPEEYFNGINIDIHGITPEKVRGKPKFPEVYQALQILLSGKIVAHHTAFDRTSLNQACAKYKLPPLECRWIDTARVVRRHWSAYRNCGYGLANVAGALGIAYQSHDASEDARAAGMILLRAMTESQMSLDQWLDHASRKTHVDWTNHEPNPDGPLYGEKICFTGALSITRDEAAAIAARLGCEITPGVNKHTTILVVGDQDQWRLAGYEKSTKHRSAEAWIAKGHPIRIIGENDFDELIKVA